MEKAGASFAAPQGVTPTGLQAAVDRIETLNFALHDAEVVLHRIRQQLLLEKSAVYQQTLAVNDQIKAQARRNPQLSKIFERVRSFFFSLRPKRKHEEPKEAKDDIANGSFATTPPPAP